MQGPERQAESGHGRAQPSKQLLGGVTSNAALAAAYQANQAASRMIDPPEEAATSQRHSSATRHEDVNVEQAYQPADEASGGAPWDVSRRRVLQQATGLEANEPGLPGTGTGTGPGTGTGKDLTRSQTFLVTLPAGSWPSSQLDLERAVKIGRKPAAQTDGHRAMTSVQMLDILRHTRLPDHVHCVCHRQACQCRRRSRSDLFLRTCERL